MKTTYKGILTIELDSLDLQELTEEKELVMGQVMILVSESSYKELATFGHIRVGITEKDLDILIRNKSRHFGNYKLEVKS